MTPRTYTHLTIWSRLSYLTVDLPGNAQAFVEWVQEEFGGKGQGRAVLARLKRFIDSGLASMACLVSFRGGGRLHVQQLLYDESSGSFLLSLLLNLFAALDTGFCVADMLPSLSPVLRRLHGPSQLPHSFSCGSVRAPTQNVVAFRCQCLC